MTVGRVQVAGGPKIDMLYGRSDLPEEQCGDTDGLPAGNAPFPDSDGPAGHLRNVFYRMGFNDQEIVALSGAHTLGRAFKNRSGVPSTFPVTAGCKLEGYRSSILQTLVLLTSAL